MAQGLSKLNNFIIKIGGSMVEQSQRVVLVFLLFVWSPFVLASVSLKGFGNLTYSITDNDKANFNRVSSDGSFVDFSKLGAQLDSQISDSFRLSSQVLVSQDPILDDTAKLSLETLFIGIQASSALEIRLGRLRGPFYMRSEYVNVQHNFLEATAPESVYNLTTFNNYNGIDMVYSMSPENAEYVIELQPYYGVSEVEAAAVGKAYGTWTAGLAFAIKGFNWGLKGSYNTGEYRLGKSLEQFSKETGVPVAVLDKLLINNDIAYLYNLGFYYEDDWLIYIEGAQIKFENALQSPDIDAFYTTIGYQFSYLAPYIRYQTSYVPIVNQRQGKQFNRGYRNYSVGLRANVNSNYLIKAELSHIDNQKSVLGTYGSTIFRSNQAEAKTITQFTLSFDVIF